MELLRNHSPVDKESVVIRFIFVYFVQVILGHNDLAGPHRKRARGMSRQIRLGQ
jgi:hypothetical protein